MTLAKPAPVDHLMYRQRILNHPQEEAPRWSQSVEVHRWCLESEERQLSVVLYQCTMTKDSN
jgi:hypothetical protein